MPSKELIRRKSLVPEEALRLIASVPRQFNGNVITYDTFGQNGKLEVMAQFDELGRSARLAQQVGHESAKSRLTIERAEMLMMACR